jgi:hypothetical protein
MPALKGLSSPSGILGSFPPTGITTLAFGYVWYAGPNAVGNAIGYAQYFSRSHDAVIRVYDDAGDVIETHEHKGDFKDW